MSNPTHYSGPELGVLLAQVREELGEDATIHEANKVRSGGIGGFFAKERFEISASPDTAEIDPSALSTSDMDAAGLTDSDMASLDLSKIRNRFDDEDFAFLGDEVPSEQDNLLQPPPRQAAGEVAEKSISFNFDRLGPRSIPPRLEFSDSESSRAPVPTPAPMLARLESIDTSSPSIGEVVADALLERAELVNALEHLGATDQIAATQAKHNGAHESKPSFRQILDDSLNDPFLEEAYDGASSGGHTAPAEGIAPMNEAVADSDSMVEDQPLTTSEAVAQRIASQEAEKPALAQPVVPAELAVPAETGTQPSEAEIPERLSSPTSSFPEQIPRVEILPDDAVPAPSVGVAPSSNLDPSDEQSLSNNQGFPDGRHLSDDNAPAPIEPSGKRDLPDFWARMALAREELALYQLPRSNVTAIIGPLDLALPIARRTQQDDWIGIEDLAVLSSRASIAGIPSWQTVTKVNDLHWAMNEWCATHRRGLVVIDTMELQTTRLLSMVAQLRSNGADLVRIALPADADVGSVINMASEIGPPIAVDLPSGTPPGVVMSALDNGLSIGSVAGLPLSPELLVALRSELHHD